VTSQNTLPLSDRPSKGQFTQKKPSLQENFFHRHPKNFTFTGNFQLVSTVVIFVVFVKKFSETKNPLLVMRRGFGNLG
jgi:hypothetical protein